MSSHRLTRLLWGISLPIMFAQVSEIVLHVINTLFLARVGVVELGAIGIADSIWELFLVLPLGLVDGIQILTARHLGRRQSQAAGAVFDQGLQMVLIVAVALALALGLAVKTLAMGLVSSPAVGAATVQYLRIACFGLPFLVVNFAYGALLTSLGRTRVLIPATLLLAATNCLLDWVFIFGHFGLPRMGIRGAGVASVIAEAVAFVFLTGALVTMGEVRRLQLFRWRAWHRGVGRRLQRISAPVMGQALAQASCWFVFFLILERVSPAALAVGNVVYSCFEVFLVPTEAFAETACSIVSRFVGRDRGDRIGPLIQRSTTAAVLATLPLLVLALALPELLLSPFRLESALVAPGALGLRVVALAMLVVIPAEMWHTAVIGSGDTPAALGIELVQGVVMVAATWFAGLVLGSTSLVWCSLVPAMLVTLAVSYLWMRSGRWRRALA